MTELRKQQIAERRRLDGYWKAQINRPYSTAVSKSSTKQTTFGFTQGMFVSRRGVANYGTPPERKKI
mgnify:CR=1 FL=1